MYTLLSTGDVPGAATYFNPLLQQTIVPCTSGTRPSSPPTGMHIFETDTARLAKYTGSAWEYVASSRTSFTPTLMGTTTNPTLGSGGNFARAGWYSIGPGRVTFGFYFRFGTSGVNAGSGTYQVGLPINAADVHGGNFPAIGSAQIFDNSASSVQVYNLYVTPAFDRVELVNNSSTITNSSPWAWAASDYLTGTITYPI